MLVVFDKSIARPIPFRPVPTLLRPTPPVTPDAPLRTALEQLAAGASLDAPAAAAAFDVVMRGEASPVQIAALLMGLRGKGETADELAGAATALRRAMVRLDVGGGDGVVDTCGTGGGRVGTLNLSTAAAFVVAGAGVRVAKHGNRSFTSRSGSADVLEALGVEIGVAAERAAGVLEAAGLVFLFAPNYHPAMRHVGPVRRELAVPTIMNLLGPLANPAGVRRQVIGVADPARLPLLAAALARLGACHALVLHAEIGMDEVSPAGATVMYEVREGSVEAWTLDPTRYGLACDDLRELAGGEPAENAARIEDLLAGGGAPATRCAVLLNAGAALYVSGNGWAMDEAMGRAAESLDSGAAHEALERLRRAAPRGAE